MQESTADLNQVDGTLTMWCEECGINNIGECWIHGGNMTITHDNTPPPKACLSLPKVLAIKRAKNFDIYSMEARKGVFAKKSIKIRTLFGPMEAVILQTKPHLPHGSMEYMVLGKNGERLYLDTSDKYTCNWMMFVRPANNYSQQNLAAFENNGQIFFVTCKNIPAGAELRVWYAAAYAKVIGKYCLMPELSDRIKSIKKEKVSKNLVDNSNETEKNQNVKLEGSGGNPNCLIENKTEENLKQVRQIHNSVEHIPPTAPESSSQVIDVHMYTCGACYTSFARPRQLESHVCILFRDKSDSLANNPRRRKGKPKKISGSSPVEVAAKVYMSGFLGSDEFNYNTEGLTLQGETNEESHSQPNSRLPEVLLDTPGPDCGAYSGEVVNKVKPKGRPGRPRKKKSIDLLLTKPVKETTKEQNFTCSNCSMEFLSKAKFLQHNNCGTVSYVCQFENCSKVFASKFKYHRHKITHERPNNFECKLCESKFNRLDHLKNHMLVHDSNRNKFVCDTCGKSYLYKSTLLFHKAKHEADEGSSLSCLVCKETFLSKEALKEHINVHNRYKRDDKVHLMSCPDCGKQFPSEKDIRRHRVTHTKERPFLCEHCPHTFLRKDHLRRHYSVSHKKELFELQMKTNSFGCHHCYQVFKKQEFLDYHNKTMHPNGVETVDKKKTKEKPLKNFAKTVNIESLDANSVFQKVSKTIKPLIHGSIIKQKLLLKQREIVQQDNVQGQVDSLPGQLLVQPQQQSSQTMLQPQQQSSHPMIQPQQQSSQPMLQPQQQSTQPLSENDPYPVSILKVHQPNDQEVLLASQPASVFYTSPLQTLTSQGPLFDRMGRDVPSNAGKAVPFRVHNQVLSQVQLQAPTRSHMQLENQQLQQQQQDQLQQEQQQQSSQQQHLIQQQLQQHQHQVQQYNSSNNASNAIQIQQLLLPQQFTLQQQPQQQGLTQPVAHIIQGINMSDFQGTNSANIFIAIDSQNLVSLQGLNLGKPMQQMVIKDNTLDGKQLMQSLIHVPQQQGPLKSDGNCLISSNGQILRTTLDNRTLAQLLNGTSRAPDLKAAQALEDETNRVIGQMNSSFIPTSNIIKSLSQNTRIQGDVLVTQSQLSDHTQLPLQPQLQAQLMQPQIQAQLMQQQQLQSHAQQQSSQTCERVDQQDLSSFSVAWPDSFDFKPVGEMTISADVSSSTSMDNLGLHQGSCWILQQQPTSSDQQQIQTLQVQNQQMQNSPLFTLSNACTIPDS